LIARCWITRTAPGRLSITSAISAPLNPESR
jgi:hypothetical protein